MNSRFLFLKLQVLFSLSFLAIAFLFQACSLGDYLGAYFNTYYNATRLFSEAEDELLNQPGAKQRDTTYLAPFAASATTKTKLTSVVEKCSKLLQYHPESNLVDDALRMIGKSYFYQDELQKAERKFGELIENTTDETMRAEGRLYLAFTFYRMNEKDRAEAAALGLADSTGENDPEISARAFDLLGHIKLERLDFGAAQQAFSHAASLARTPEDRARFLIKVAEIHQRDGRYDDALDAYREASGQGRPAYETVFIAQKGEGKMLVLLSRFEEALDLFENMRSNTNLREYFGEIDLEIGNVYRAAGRTEDAIAQYRYVDTTYARTEASAQSHYRRGLLYENFLRDYDSAFVAYNSGKSQFPQSPVSKLLAARAGYLMRYRILSREIARLDSMSFALANPPPVQIPDSISQDSLAHPSDSVNRAPIPLTLSPDSIATSRARNMAELAGLFYGSLEVSDSARFWYTQLLIQYPASPLTPRAQYTLAQILSQDSPTSKSTVDSLYRLIIDMYPESEFADASRAILGLPPRLKVVDQTGVLYSEAEHFLNQDSLDEALAVFRRIVLDYPSSPMAPKAQYAIGWVYEQLRPLPDSAVANYRRLAGKYPGTQYASAVMAKLASAGNQIAEPANKDQKPQGTPGEVPPVPPGRQRQPPLPPPDPSPDPEDAEIDSTWDVPPDEDPDP